ncbi:hypothetical protein KFE25_006478 [Diacronema lutheri]|uniref:Uncharacterized protein n=1 Tax=Diacronema lutheri TaxID=2081491 RepID=A0A8J5XQW2_DIALT|nr:hypothetical protein KFE25_006478 [Diacronema lutheri]
MDADDTSAHKFSVASAEPSGDVGQGSRPGSTPSAGADVAADDGDDGSAAHGAADEASRAAHDSAGVMRGSTEPADSAHVPPTAPPARAGEGTDGGPQNSHTGLGSFHRGTSAGKAVSSERLLENARGERAGAPSSGVVGGEQSDVMPLSPAMSSWSTGPQGDEYTQPFGRTHELLETPPKHDGVDGAQRWVPERGHAAGVAAKSGGAEPIGALATLEAGVSEPEPIFKSVLNDDDLLLISDIEGETF